MPKNAKGRDFVVGDLHGHHAVLEIALHRVGFEPAFDRVFSVGDLIDRGPASVATLSLIEEPWFHAVLGNHELLMLNYLGFFSSRIHARKAYPLGAGAWITEALAKQRKLLARLAEQVSALPLAIHVSDDIPFRVAHGNMPDLYPSEGRSSSVSTISVHQAEITTSCRARVAMALQADLTTLHFEGRDVQVSEEPISFSPITYVGHSPIRSVTVHDSYVYIEQGVCARSKRSQPVLTLLDHRRFARWLFGVPPARRPPVASLVLNASLQAAHHVGALA